MVNDATEYFADVYKYIAFIRERNSFTSLFVWQLENGTLALRITHNDTKLNNVLINDKTSLVALIDLNTFMLGRGCSLDRARTQFKLVSDMEKNIDNMRAIIKKIFNK